MNLKKLLDKIDFATTYVIIFDNETSEVLAKHTPKTKPMLYDDVKPLLNRKVENIDIFQGTIAIYLFPWEVEE